MPKDVRLPDGTIIKNVPDNITKSELMRRLGAVRDEPIDSNPASGGVRGFFEGVGSGISDVALGLKQIPSEIAASLPASPFSAGAASMAPILRQQVQEKRDIDRPLVETGSGLGGKVVGNILATAPTALIPGAGTLRGATMVGGALGASQPAESLEERTINTLVGSGGGAIGQRIGSIFAGRAPAATPAVSTTTGGSNVGIAASASPTVRASGGGSGFGYVGPDPSSGLSAGQRLAAQRGTEMGMRLTPGEAIGSRSLQQMEAKLSSQPMTSGPFNAIKDQNQRVLNRAWAEAIGVDGDDLSAPVLASAYARMSDVFETIPQRIGTQDIDPQSAFRLFSSLQEQFQGVTAKPVLNEPLIKEVIKMAERGEATGQQLRGLTSRLGKKINSEYKNGDPNLGDALGQAKEFVDDVIENGLDEFDRGLYQTARNRYRNYKLLTKNVGVINPSDGNVRGASLANVLQTQDKAGFLRGGNQTNAYNAARFAQAFKPIVGDSGTATRSMINNPLELLASAPFNIAGRAYTAPTTVSAISNINSGIDATAGLLGPFVDPRFLGLLGANAAVQSGR